MIFDSETANWIWIALTLGSMLCKLAAAIAHGAAEINGSDPITSGLLEDLRLEVGALTIRGSHSSRNMF